MIGLNNVNLPTIIKKIHKSVQMINFLAGYEDNLSSLIAFSR